jgi:hypothetical protein
VTTAARRQVDPKRAQVRFDKYAIFDIAREHSLKANECWLLTTLCFVADFRNHAFRGTIFEIAEWTRIGRSTVPKLLDALQREGLVDIVRPFGQNRAGEVVILVWERLIANTSGRQIAEKSAIVEGRAATSIAEQSQINRRVVAEKSAIDQPKDDSGRNKAIRKEVGSVPQCEREGGTKDTEPKCAFPGCSESISGHTFGAHEPVAPPDSDDVRIWIESAPAGRLTRDSADPLMPTNAVTTFKTAGVKT